jgi:hypothetical protein
VLDDVQRHDHVVVLVVEPGVADLAGPEVDGPSRLGAHVGQALVAGITAGDAAAVGPADLLEEDALAAAHVEHLGADVQIDVLRQALEAQLVQETVAGAGLQLPNPIPARAHVPVVVVLAQIVGDRRQEGVAAAGADVQVEAAWLFPVAVAKCPSKT